MRLSDRPSSALVVDLSLAIVFTLIVVCFLPGLGLNAIWFLACAFAIVHFSNYWFPGYAKSLVLTSFGISFETYFGKVRTIPWTQIIDVYDLPFSAGVVVLTAGKRYVYRIWLADSDRYVLMGWFDIISPLLPTGDKQRAPSGFAPDPIPPVLKAIKKTLESAIAITKQGEADEKYDVAISYASEDRDHARKIADGLREKQITVFYDEYATARLWGQNLVEKLERVFGESARFCLMLISENYVSKKWPTHERRAALAKALESNTPYILPVKIDDTKLPGLVDSTSYVDLRRISHQQVVELVIDKLRAGR